MKTATEPATAPGLTRRTLLLRDSLIFISLALLVLTLFGVTLLLFRSFTARRAALARRWHDRGRVALASGRASDAVDALRVTLNYAPDDLDTEFLLAQALDQSGHLDEASNYLNELWEQRPGSGTINLERARIDARRGMRQRAIESYRAAIYGTWEGDGVARRREIRLELARYLLVQHDTDAARAELLVAGGNTSGDAGAELAIAQLLMQADATSDAYRFFLQAAADPVHSVIALISAGEIDFTRGHFASARQLYLRANSAATREVSASAQRTQIASRLQLLSAVLALAPSPELSDSERVRRILQGRTIARARLRRCQKEGQSTSPAFADLVERWSTAGATPSRSLLLRDRSRQQSAIDLNEETERVTRTTCHASRDALSLEDQALLLCADSGSRSSL